MTFSKLRFSQKENLKKCINFEDQKDTRYIQRNVYIGIIVFSCLSSTETCLRFLLNYFVQEIKSFYQSSFGIEVHFRDIMNISPNILTKNSNIKKLRQGFVDERAIIKTSLMFSCHWKNPIVGKGGPTPPPLSRLIPPFSKIPPYKMSPHFIGLLGKRK